MDVSQEKVHIENVEAADSDRNSPSTKVVPLSPDEFGFTPAEQRKIKWKIDRRLVLTVGMLYCVSLIDRTNLAAASIAGLREDLKMNGNQYVSSSPLPGLSAPALSFALTFITTP